MRILLADGNLHDRKLFASSLARVNPAAELEMAENGVEVLAKVCSFDTQGAVSPPALVVLDLDLPPRGAIHVLRTIKEDSVWRSTMVVVLARSDSAADVAKAYGAHANGYFVKSVPDFDRVVADVVNFATRAEHVVRGHESRSVDERLRAAMEASPVGMVLVDRAGTIALANHASEHIFGYEPGELTGVAIDTLVPQRARELHRNLRSAYLDDPEPRKMGVGRDLVAVRKDDTVFPVEVGLNPIKTAMGSWVMCTVIDIAGRQRVNEQLSRQAREFARSNAELEEFARLVSHDLQEPLRMVSGFVRLLDSEYRHRLDATAHSYIDFAVDGANRMQQLLSELLAYARLSRPGTEPAEVRVEDALTAALANLRESIEATRAEISYGKLPVVTGVYPQLVELFQRLVDNALKFRRGDPPTVNIEASDRHECWEFSVADNGIGIARQHLEDIFHVFRRLHARTEYPGTGIGLAACKRIVERHGGRIWMESDVRQGSTARFTLPAVRR